MALALTAIHSGPAETYRSSEYQLHMVQFFETVRSYVLPHATNAPRDSYFHNVRIFKDETGFFLHQQNWVDLESTLIKSKKLAVKPHFSVSVKGNVENTLVPSQEICARYTYTIPDKDERQQSKDTSTVVGIHAKYEYKAPGEINLHEEVKIIPSLCGQLALLERLPDLKAYMRSDKPPAFSLKAKGEDGETVWYVEQNGIEANISARLSSFDVAKLRVALALSGIVIPYVAFIKNKIYAFYDGQVHILDCTIPTEKEIKKRIRKHLPMFKMEYKDLDRKQNHPAS